MRPNPLLMTVMGNPCHSRSYAHTRQYIENPFILIDSKTNKIIRTWRGSMTDRKPWDWATDAARRLGRPVFVVAHPYVPKTFRAGIEVSPLFYSGGGFQEVRPDGSVGPAPSFGYRRNPSFIASMAGGLTGGLVANALSNPRGPSDPDMVAARELELYINNDSTLYRQQFIPIVKNLMKRRMNGTYDHEKAAKPFLYLADAGAKKYYKEYTSGTGFKFDLATRWAVAKSLRDSFEQEAELGNYDKMTWGVSNNPLSRREAGRVIEDARRDIRHGSSFSPGFTRTERAGQAFGKAKVVYRHGPRAARHAAVRVADRAQKLAGTTLSNPGPVGKRRKVTMSLEAFAKYIKSKNDPKLWKDFIRKVKGYQKWTHGSLPKNVTIEVVDKPGVSGLWMTYDAGTVPESAYVMPANSKRKGAWKHPWDTPPKIKHDPDAGIIMHKLSGKSKVTDFYHK